MEVFDGLGANMNSKVEELEVVKTRLCERVVDVEGRRLIISKELWRNLKKWPKNIGWENEGIFGWVHVLLPLFFPVAVFSGICFLTHLFMSV